MVADAPCDGQPARRSASLPPRARGGVSRARRPRRVPAFAAAPRGQEPLPPARGGRRAEHRKRAQFFADVLGDVGAADKVRFSDHQLDVYLPTKDDDEEAMIVVARAASPSRARSMTPSAACPSPTSTSTPTRGATPPPSTARSSSPAARRCTGSRSGPAWSTARSGAPKACSAQRTSAATPPRASRCAGARRRARPARAALEGGGGAELASVRAFRPSAPTGARLTLERPGATRAPRRSSRARAPLPLVLEARGERRVERPYR